METHLRPLGTSLRTTVLMGCLVVTVGCANAATDSGEDSTGQVQSASTPHRSNVLDACTEFRDWKFIVIHHSATQSGSLESIDAVHRQRRDASGHPWRGIGYHFLIGNGNGMPDGKVQSSFRWEEQLSGAHAGLKLYNELGIGICLIGNFETSGPTSAQLEAVRMLIAELKAHFGITTEQVLKHGDLKATACPGRHFPFQEIASTPADGLQLANDKDHTRTATVQVSDTKGVNRVISVIRFSQRKSFALDRQAGGRNEEE